LTIFKSNPTFGQICAGGLEEKVVVLLADDGAVTQPLIDLNCKFLIRTSNMHQNFTPKSENLKVAGGWADHCGINDTSFGKKAFGSCSANPFYHRRREEGRATAPQ